MLPTVPRVENTMERGGTSVALEFSRPNSEILSAPEKTYLPAFAVRSVGVIHGIEPFRQ
jgi:hypothetical protein